MAVPIRPRRSLGPGKAAVHRAQFQLVSPFEPAGDQPQAIEQLLEGLNEEKRHQTLLGVTGSGKTFTMANVIARSGRPALVLSHNKTLAAQLYSEFKEFFPHNAVRYFVSYYDYYQPEAYIPQRDIYIEKDAAINEEIERLRLACTSALVSRRDVVVVASVSCIYGLGSPEDYKKLTVSREGRPDRSTATRCSCKFVDIQYDRNDVAFERGKFRVRGDVVELWPAYEEIAFRIELFGDEVESPGDDRPAHRQSSSSARRTVCLPGQALRAARGADRWRRRGDHARSWTSGFNSSRITASCSKPSGWPRGRGTTSKCFWKSAIARGSRTTSRHLSGRKPGRDALHAARLLSAG